MRRLAGWMILIAALTGTPLRQAEAADDFCRSIMETLQPASLEIPDGGVGDDSGVGTLSAAHGIGFGDPLTSPAPLFALPISMLSPTARGAVESLRERVWWMPNPPNERRAWLQAFLF